MADCSVKTLDAVKAHYRGEHGGHGKRARQTGRTGQDVVVKVSVGGSVALAFDLLQVSST